MLYALKDESNKIIALSEHLLDDNWYEVNAKDSEVVSFLQNNPGLAEKLMKDTDTEFIRVLEDLIDLLIDKSLIHFTDFPDAVQLKLLNRRQLREEIRSLDVNRLLDQDGTVL